MNVISDINVSFIVIYILNAYMYINIKYIFMYMCVCVCRIIYKCYVFFIKIANYIKCTSYKYFTFYKA